MTTSPDPEASASVARPTATRARPSLRLSIGLVVGVVAIAAAGYAVKGSPQLARAGLGGAAYADVGEAAASAASTRDANIQQIAKMVDILAQRLKDRPEDAEGWFMLARSYTLLGRFADSLPAYARSDKLRPNDPNLLADWAEAAAATRNDITDAEVVALIDRALAIDPTQPKALALGGSADYERGDFARAIRRWQLFAERLPAGSELRGQVDASIADARSKLDQGAAAGGAAGATAAAPAASGVATRSGNAAAAQAAVAGTVTLSSALAASAVPGDTVFVFARAASGPRVPLAARRAKVSELPLTFSLDDSMAMTPSMTISKAERIVVGARISKSGDATPQRGDLAGESVPVRPGATGVVVTIDRAVP